MSASASTIIDRNASGVTLKVSPSGQALVSYTARGKRWNVLAWGAVNALAPTPGGKQVDFKLDYSGGWGTYQAGRLEDAQERVRAVHGASARLARDGLHRARRQPLGDCRPGSECCRTTVSRPTPKQAVWELRLSHWTGDLPVLTVNTNWAYRKFDHVFGTFTYDGTPVHGFRSTAGGNPLDSFGRNLYMDTFNSAYGTGWKRENSFLMHKNTGTFCYGFYPHGNRPAGHGERYRATIIGPGVTPDVMWQGDSPGAYDEFRDRELADAQRATYSSRSPLQARLNRPEALALPPDL